MQRSFLTAIHRVPAFLLVRIRMDFTQAMQRVVSLGMLALLLTHCTGGGLSEPKANSSLGLYTITQRQLGAPLRKGELLERSGLLRVHIPRRARAHDVSFVIHHKIQKGGGDETVVVTDHTTNRVSTFAIDDENGTAMISVPGAQVPITFNPDGTITIDGQVQPDEEASAQVIAHHPALQQVSAETYVALHEALGLVTPSTSKAFASAAGIIAISVLKITDYVIKKVTEEGPRPFTPNTSSMFVSHLNQRCMDVPDANFSSGNQIQTWDCNGTAAQQWTFVGKTVRIAGKCLDVAEGATSNGTAIRLWDCNGTVSQDFTFTLAGELISQLANKCVDIKDVNPDNGARLHLWDCLGVPNQKWSIGGAPFVSRMHNKCMDVPNADFSNGKQIQMWGCNGTVAQLWTHIDSTVQIGGKCLDVANGATSSGTSLQLWDCNGTEAQRFTRTTAGELFNPVSNKCVDIEGGNLNDGARVQLWDCIDIAANQKWAFGPTGSAPFVSRMHDKCMDVPDADFSNGKQIQMWGCNGNAAQQWTFVGNTVRIANKCLEVAQGTTSNGTALQLWDCNGTAAQNFTLNAAGELVSQSANKCVDIAGGNQNDGARVQIWDCIDIAANQKWDYR